MKTQHIISELMMLKHSLAQLWMLLNACIKEKKDFKSVTSVPP